MSPRILSLLALAPSVASAAVTLGFEEFAGNTPDPQVPPTAFVGQPYPDSIVLTTNQPFYIWDAGVWAPEGSQFISGGGGTTYDIASAGAGISLLGVSLHGFEGQEPLAGPWPSGTVLATIRLYSSGNSLAATINVTTSAVGAPTSYVFSDYTGATIDRIVIADSATPDSGGFAVDAIVISGTAVPEPSTYGLMVGGLALAAVAARRRAKAA